MKDLIIREKRHDLISRAIERARREHADTPAWNLPRRWQLRNRIAALQCQEADVHAEMERIRSR